MLGGKNMGLSQVDLQVHSMIRRLDDRHRLRQENKKLDRAIEQSKQERTAFYVRTQDRIEFGIEACLKEKERVQVYVEKQKQKQEQVERFIQRKGQIRREFGKKVKRLLESQVQASRVETCPTQSAEIDYQPDLQEHHAQELETKIARDSSFRRLLYKIVAPRGQVMKSPPKRTVSLSREKIIEQYHIKEKQRRIQMQMLKALQPKNKGKPYLAIGV